MNTRAFTLMEVLIATVIFSIVLTAINVTFYSAFRLRAKTTRLLEQSMPVNQALSTIKKDLRGILPPGGDMTGNSCRMPPATANWDGSSLTRPQVLF